MLAIISNNCWGAGAYQEAGVPYNTPTVGLWFYPDHYISFLARFREMVFRPISFLPLSSRGHSHYPVGLIADGIEVQFEHYRSDLEARIKWTARCARLPLADDDIMFKIDDRDGLEIRHLEAFDALPFKRKIAFIKRGRFDVTRFPWAFELESIEVDSVPDGLALWDITKNHDRMREIYPIRKNT